MTLLTTLTRPTGYTLRAGSISDAFIEALQGSHTVVAKAEWWSFDRMVLSTDLRADLALLDGSVTIDRNAAVRRNSSITLLIRGIDIFRDYVDPVHGLVVKLYRGVQFDDGTVEYLQVGSYKMNSYSITEYDGTFEVSLNGYDLSNAITRNKWSTPYKVAAGTNYMTAISNILADRATGFTLMFSGEATIQTTPDLFYGEGDDPWAAAMNLAEAIGCELYFDQFGVACVRTVQDPMDMVPKLNLTSAPDSVRLGQLKRSGEVSDMYNKVICRASAPWLLFPIEGSAQDNDPYSPTWVGGSYGTVTKVVKDATVTTIAQCNAMALAELRKILGKTEKIDFETLVDPRIEGGDVVTLFDQSEGVSSVHVIQTYTVPLRSGASSGTVKTQRKFIT